MIQFTIDTPSSHENDQLLILDIQASMNKSEKNRLYFEFYEKPTKNLNIILSDSAIPAKQTKKNNPDTRLSPETSKYKSGARKAGSKHLSESIYDQIKKIRIFSKV